MLLSSLILLRLLRTGHRPGVFTAPHDQLRREPAVPQFPARLQRALQGPRPSPASLAGGHQGAAQLQRLTPPPTTVAVEGFCFLFFFPKRTLRSGGGQCIALTADVK